jgi:MFS family permease
MLLIGIGGGLTLPAFMTLAMSGTSTEDAGLASGLVGTAAQLGGALGLAVLATISTAQGQEVRVAGASLDSALTGGYHLAFGITAGLVLSSIAVAATLLPRASSFTPAARVQKSVVRAAVENPVGHFERQRSEIVCH